MLGLGVEHRPVACNLQPATPNRVYQREDLHPERRNTEIKSLFRLTVSAPTVGTSIPPLMRAACNSPLKRVPQHISCGVRHSIERQRREMLMELDRTDLLAALRKQAIDAAAGTRLRHAPGPACAEQADMQKRRRVIVASAEQVVPRAEWQPVRCCALWLPHFPTRTRARLGGSCLLAQP